MKYISVQLTYRLSFLQLARIILLSQTCYSPGPNCSKLRNVERSTYQSLIASSLSVQGPRLFNSLPRYIRNINNYTKDYFKQKLDEFLSRIPDEPLIPNYVGMRRAQSNSLVDMIKSIGLNELDGW